MKLAKRFAQACTKGVCSLAIGITAMKDIRGKRLFFISSVMAAAFSETEWFKTSFSSIKERLVRINEMLELADDFTALELPMMMHRIVWGDTQEKLCEDALQAARKGDKTRLSELCAELVRLAPTNLRYGRSEEMAEDISQQFMKVAAFA